MRCGRVVHSRHIDDEGTGRVDTLPETTARLAELTLEEKVALCAGSDHWHTAPVPRQGIPAVMVSDGPHGLRRERGSGAMLAVSDGGAMLAVSDGGDRTSLPATCFPTASALGSSWDPDLVRGIGRAIGVEAHAQGVAVVLGPGINIKRTPLCGRNFEYYSEDPLLAGVLGAALVEGLQSQGVGGSVKHLAANNQETQRRSVSADVDERTLREIYLAAFERVVTQARPWTVMCSYNRVNGVFASQHRWLLTDVLRGDWGYDGLVVSDWDAVHDRVAALTAGLDLEMPPKFGVSDTALLAAVRDGSLPEEVLDEAVSRVLRLVDLVRSTGADRSGSPATPDSVTSPAGFDVDAHHALARAAAAECAVLLKNDGDLLPLRPAAGDVVAVIGGFARTPYFQGDGSARVNPTRVDAALDALRAAVPAGVEVAFAAGFGIGTTDGDTDLADEAIVLARRAGVVVVFLGLPPDVESEGYDRAHMDLPDNQTALIPRLAAVNPHVVVVLANGAAVRLSTWEEHAGAILEGWLAGQAAGGATADLLLGAANPSGRLAETLPLRLQDGPSYVNFPGELGHVRYGEGVFVGYRWYDAVERDVSYPFGHGLTYTTFEYADLTARIAGRADGGDLAVTVACTVTNTGQRVGKEVVQLYVGDPEAQVARPVRELRAFAKVGLEPGRSKTVTFHLGVRDLSYWSIVHRGWWFEAGAFEIAIGASSRDLRLTTTVDILA
jgi:beta-glucosidase